MGLLRKKKTIGFWAGDENNFQFVDPLIEGLSKKYKVRKYNYDGDANQLESQVRSVDVAWFEWANGPVVPASQANIDTPIINRAHRYELYSDTPAHINWEAIDKSIFSSPSMIIKFHEKFKQQSKVAKPELIGIGVDTDLFKFNDKKLSKQVIYVGRIHPHKNPSLLLQILGRLTERDSDYRTTIIGGFSDELYEEYFHDQVKKLKLTNKINLLEKMPQTDLVKHYQQADSFIISSIIEGLSQASLEAMSCGARPVIADYYGSEQGYPKKYIYRTVDEAVDMILNPIGTRQQSRDIVDSKYALKDTIARVQDIIEEILDR